MVIYLKLKLTPSTTLRDVKRGISQAEPQALPDRQSLRLEPKGKTLKDDDTLASLGLKTGSKLYVKDLGPQIGWVTVFLAEYAGPLFIYLWFYQRPWLFYGDTSQSPPVQHVVHLAAGCYTFHYAKRILETLFVHRFSHATMPIMNLFKNCSYYWMFTAYVAYHVNHPLFTSPSIVQVYAGLAAFVLSEVGNLSIHVALRNLRPPGTKVRRIPVATGNPYTALFNFVSCPNYTYEFLSWVSFTVMTQCLPAALFTFAGMYQMTIWALGKHRNYKKEFSNYPKQRKAILPFLI
ncbi:LOW QUALITY PROTEIN: very-long-chain enoyl-CoA reductase-like [Nilaparvata lugens]|uniref:LOW QUALITY PROTEIN: very-long-chain enoyl-CoA reductase-like n=1 Tax=Nilaparvata lugens TaxID=108931 RepID=UPI00193E108D|nr:LOW QUALITY PROTEIN: very-long-chain enoyl-CoA reductase-like [Nilaparvata lugens]